jgi:hypothetical protein
VGTKGYIDKREEWGGFYRAQTIISSPFFFLAHKLIYGLEGGKIDKK